jgi:tetratricopeptide (TPR) repeat protein
VCLQCHALKTQLRPGYLPGARLADHYSLGLPHLVARELRPDGRVTAFAYQESHRWSECYRNGGMRCTDCHEPHGQRYRDVDRLPLEGPFDDGQCTSCHPGKLEEGTRHTRHRPDSPGGRCVACHMPYLQQPSVGGLVRYARSDHVIPVPRPAFDSRLGLVSACAACHAGISTDSLEAAARAWWGVLKPHDQAVSALFKADSARSRPEAAALLLADRPRFPAAALQGLAAFLRGYLSPDLPDLEPAVLESLVRLGGSADPDVAALALASLHLAQGERAAVRTTLARRLAALGDAEPGVRRRWTWVLLWAGDLYLARGNPQSALSAYRKAAEVLPGDPAVLRATGLARSALNDHRGAELAFRRALAADSTDVQAMVNLAFELQMLRDQAGSLAWYRRALELNPWEPATYFSYGNALARTGDVEGAIRAYREAARLKPRFVQAELALARAYAQTGDRRSAEQALRRVLSFDPANAPARQALAALGARF